MITIDHIMIWIWLNAINWRGMSKSIMCQLSILYGRPSGPSQAVLPISMGNPLDTPRMTGVIIMPWWAQARSDYQSHHNMDLIEYCWPILLVMIWTILVNHHWQQSWLHCGIFGLAAETVNASRVRRASACSAQCAEDPEGAHPPRGEQRARRDGRVFGVTIVITYIWVVMIASNYTIAGWADWFARPRG